MAVYAWKHLWNVSLQKSAASFHDEFYWSGLNQKLFQERLLERLIVLLNREDLAKIKQTQHGTCKGVDVKVSISSVFSWHSFPEKPIFFFAWTTFCFCHKGLW